jgi:hypothetical protein
LLVTFCLVKEDRGFCTYWRLFDAIKSFGFIAPKTLYFLAFQSFDIERHLMGVIPETRRAH